MFPESKTTSICAVIQVKTLKSFILSIVMNDFMEQVPNPNRNRVNK